MPDPITESSLSSISGISAQTNIGVAGSSETPVVAVSHLFYLYPSDSPGITLVSTIYDGKGYGGWRRGILIALSAKNKIGFIDGTILRSTISPVSLNSWSRCNYMVISWLLNSLSKEIAKSALYSRTAREIWERLEERFGQSNGPQLYHLQK
ncbi:hypothetical protein KY290_037590 [Solanum tuberosum]|uniref:Retrotransposon Copia-like N-terminal domain-containing protein n=1 Tax=Solanum tuberosum TaxID=4113 RepID=A0ABQ7TWL2_SOLTU|nr:hypothetical protein KY289_037110 [Solanum tuberosum]KAH0738885.1 hypothetical protein KY290_037590 [Solanum tuberosum]